MLMVVNKTEVSINQQNVKKIKETIFRVVDILDVL